MALPYTIKRDKKGTVERAKGKDERHSIISFDLLSPKPNESRESSYTALPYTCSKAEKGTFLFLHSTHVVTVGEEWVLEPQPLKARLANAISTAAMFARRPFRFP
jgi:hypothetical protein